MRTFDFKNKPREKETLSEFANGMRLHYYFVGNNDNSTEHPLNGNSNIADFVAKVRRKEEGCHPAHYIFLSRQAIPGADVLVTNLCVFHRTDLEEQREDRSNKILSAGAHPTLGERKRKRK